MGNNLHLVWEELNRIALLGTSRADFSPGMLSSLRSLGIPIEDTSDSKIVLEALALLGNLKKLIPELSTLEGTLPKKVNLDTNTDCLPVKHVAFFIKILQEYQGALAEFSTLAQQRKWKLPSALSPLALNLVLQNVSYWDAVAPLLDEAAWWVIEQNKDWQFLKTLPFQPLERPLERISKANHYLHEAGSGNLLTHQEGIEHAYWFEILQYDEYLKEKWHRAVANDYHRNYSMKAIINILEFRKNMHFSFDSI